jgi:uncharacterized protein involved in type VI secretion and phage assembly
MSLAAVSTAPPETGVEDGGYVKGVGIAIVTQNKDPQGWGRVKVRYTWFDQPRESNWTRCVQPMAGDNRGFAMIPEVGDEVAVCFERGDLRFPIIIGALFGGKAKSPFANSDGKNDLRVIKSRAGHHLSFNDGSRKSLELSLKDGKKVLIDDNGIAVQDDKGNHFKIDSRSGDIEISTSGKLTLKATSIELTATGSCDVKATGKLALNGATVMIN